ncbi:MAG: zinc ribbon domain-containing protein [Methanobacteriaceae archaeon]
MINEKRIFCNNCGEELFADDKFCPKCGKNRTNKKLIIGIIALIVIIAILSTVVLTDLGSQLGGVYPNAINIEGVTFHIPDGYEFGNTINVYGKNAYYYLKEYGSPTKLSGICFFVHNPSLQSFNEGKNNVKSNGYNTVDTKIGKFSGYMYTESGKSTPDSTLRFFVFEKSGKICTVSVTSDIKEADIAKIING